jgi:hypothetical protein
MTLDKKAFVKTLGKRIVERKKQGLKQGLKQRVPGATLGVSQQHEAHFEVGRRVPVSMLFGLARALSISVEDKERPRKRCSFTPVLQRQLDRISELRCSHQRFVIEMLDAVLLQSSR